jgi:RNA polymerase sigma-70 factor (ECF subfamily)
MASGQGKLTFIEVYEKAFSAVWGYAAARGLSGADLEDVVQEVFVVVHQRLHTFEGRSSVKTWVVGIAVNVIHSFRRRRATRKLGEDLEQFPEMETEKSTPRAQVAAKRDAEFLFSVLDGLSEPQSEIFILVELQEMSVVDASRILEANEETLRSRLRAARKHVNAAIARRSLEPRG